MQDKKTSSIYGADFNRVDDITPKKAVRDKVVHTKKGKSVKF
jgi:hypothetical protein